MYAQPNGFQSLQAATAAQLLSIRKVTGNKAAKSDRWGLNLGIREALQGQLLHLLLEPAIIPQVQHHILQTMNIAPHYYTA